MATTLQDPTARILDLPPQPLGSPPSPESSPTERDGWRPRRRGRRAGTSPSYSVYTARGIGRYHTWMQADSAARWVARETGRSVTVMNERSGERWDVTAGTARRDLETRRS
jgi:hypothetical protein